MGKLFGLAHWVWMEARLGLPPSLQNIILPGLHHTKEIARLITRPYFNCYEWQGRNLAGELSVAYAGLGYTDAMLKTLLFNEKPIEKVVGKPAVWQLNKFIKTLSSDIIIIEASSHLIQHLSQQHAIILPSRLQFILDTQGEWQEVEGRFRQDARRNEVKKVQKFGYEYQISRSASDLEMFYHDMYLPMVYKRHGELASVLSKQEIYQLLRHGMLFLTKREGSYVSGGLCFVEQGILRFKEMGVLNGDEQLMREGAVGAMNYLRIRWAHQQGYRGVNFGECWPYMSGIFQSKRKWGTTVSIPAHEHKRIWIKIQRNTPAVTQFFENNPCIVTDQKGNLFGLIVSSDPNRLTTEMKMNWQKLYSTPGLADLLVLSPSDMIAQSVTPTLFAREVALEH